MINVAAQRIVTNIFFRCVIQLKTMNTTFLKKLSSKHDEIIPILLELVVEKKMICLFFCQIREKNILRVEIHIKSCVLLCFDYFKPQ